MFPVPRNICSLCVVRFIFRGSTFTLRKVPQVQSKGWGGVGGGGAMVPPASDLFSSGMHLMNALMPGLPGKIYHKLHLREIPTWAEAITQKQLPMTVKGHSALRSSSTSHLHHDAASITQLLSHFDSFDPVVILLPQRCGSNLAGMLTCDRDGWMDLQGNEGGNINVTDADLKHNNLLMFCVTQDTAHAVLLVAHLLAMCNSNDVKDVIFSEEGIVYLQLHEAQV